MENIQTDIAKEISENLGLGLCAFIHKTTGEMIFVPDMDNNFDADPEDWNEELSKLKKNRRQYQEIENWSSHESFEVMREFAVQLHDIKMQGRLFTALGKRKPFREFKYEIDNSDYRQEWFAFRDQWQLEYVAKQLEQLEIPGL